MKFIDLSKQYQSYKTDIDAQIKEVVDNTAFIMGKKVSELEATLAKWTNTQYAVGCSSGTDALLLALMAIDIRPGDEIITTPFTFIATAEVISFLGAKPIFVDIKEDTYNIDPAKIESAISEKTKAIVAVDVFGQCADYDAINAIAQKHQLLVIEDAAQSFGATYKNRPACSLADFGCTSFFPAKPLGCFGDGGMVFTNNEEAAEIMKSLRVHGKGTHKYDNVRIGLNARLDTLQAAVLLAKIAHFSKEVEARNTIAARYTEALQSTVGTPIVAEGNTSVYAQYSIRVKDRGGLIEFLKSENIPTAIHYPKPLHLQSAFKNLGYGASDFPVAEKISEEIVSLPMHPFLEVQDQDFIIQRILSFYNNEGR